MIGILPNQLRVLLKQVNQNDGGFEVLSKELFWKGYGIWKSRKRLISNFWKNIAPNNWKIYEGKKKYKKDSNSIEKKEYQCQNPFHFLKRHCNLSQSIPTPCSCFHILKRKIAHKSLDIRSFFSNASHNPLSSNNTNQYTTREDLVRGAHDRVKRARHQYTEP